MSEGCKYTNRQNVPYPERSRVWDANGQVCENRKHAVGKRRLEGQVVRDLMDCQEEILVRRCANGIGSQECLP